MNIVAAKAPNQKPKARPQIAPTNRYFINIPTQYHKICQKAKTKK